LACAFVGSCRLPELYGGRLVVIVESGIVGIGKQIVGVINGFVIVESGIVGIGKQIVGVINGWRLGKGIWGFLRKWIVSAITDLGIIVGGCSLDRNKRYFSWSSSCVVRSWGRLLSWRWQWNFDIVIVAVGSVVGNREHVRIEHQIVVLFVRRVEGLGFIAVNIQAELDSLPLRIPQSVGSVNSVIVSNEHAWPCTMIELLAGRGAVDVCISLAAEDTKVLDGRGAVPEGHGHLHRSRMGGVIASVDNASDCFGPELQWAVRVNHDRSCGSCTGAVLAFSFAVLVLSVWIAQLDGHANNVCKRLDGVAYEFSSIVGAKNPRDDTTLVALAKDEHHELLGDVGFVGEEQRPYSVGILTSDQYDVSETIVRSDLEGAHHVHVEYTEDSVLAVDRSNLGIHYDGWIIGLGPCRSFLVLLADERFLL